MSIVSDVSDKCTPAECYVLDRSDMVTLPEYLHTHLTSSQKSATLYTVQ